MPIPARLPKGDFLPAPAGPTQAVCVDVVDLGLVENKFKAGTKQAKVRFVWEISKKMPDGRPFLAAGMYTNSMHEKSNMRKMLESLRGRPYTKEQMEKLDLEKVIGANAILNIVHVHRGEDTYANITSISPILDGMPKMKPTGNYTRVCERPGYVPPSYEEEEEAIEREPPLDSDPIDLTDPLVDDLPPVNAYDDDGEIPF